MDYVTKKTLIIQNGNRVGFMLGRLSTAFGLACLILAVSVSGSVFAESGTCNGNGNGGGNSGGGGTAPDYGDLIVLYRGATSGVPILTALDGETGWCQQPIAFEPETCGIEPISSNSEGVYLVPVNQETCGIEPGYEACTHEVEFGRTNVARSPNKVFEAQLEDAVVSLAVADCVTLDPSGRLVISNVSDGIVTTKAIDSPLQNLAIYKQLMSTGTLGVPLPHRVSILDTAARGLGAAADKTGNIDVDMLVYLNHLLGLSDVDTPTILDPKICIDVREEVKGQVQFVEKCFLDYGNIQPDRFTAYHYNRGRNFLVLPYPPYIDNPSGAFSEPGWFESLAQVPDSFPPLFEIRYESILSTVFADSGDFDGRNIGGFVQAADDARAVINYMHIWQVPEGFETPLICVDSGVDHYDVSISQESGLQVPVQIVDGTEGREFTITVANSDLSDPATGYVTVTATPATGGVIDGSPWVYEFSELEGGASSSWVEFFTINLGEETTISWKATAFAGPDDANPANNTVTGISQVIVTGSGN